MTQLSRPYPDRFENHPHLIEDTLLEDCAIKIAQHLKRQIILNRNNSEKANRLACMNKYIQITYLTKKSGI